MADIFYAGMPDWLDKLNQLAQGQLLPIQVDWDAAPGSILAILNKPTLAAVATSGDKGDVGLGKVSNTSDTDKPVSTAQQAALDQKASLSGAAFTGAVTGITKDMVNLGSADNTSDENKPVSKPQKAALDLKQDKLSFTPVQNGTGFGQVPTSMVKMGFTGPVLNRIKLTVDSTDFGNIAMEAAANTFAQVQMFSGRAGASSFTFNPATTDWVKAALYTQGTKGGGVAVIDNANSAGGCMWAESAVLRFGTGMFSSGTPPVLDVQAGFVTPATDNVTNLGSFNRRWSNVYAATGAIQTSDADHKTPVVPMTANQILAASQLAREIGAYKFLDAVAEKGDAARDHIGMTVQRAIEVLESHQLNPFAHGFICHDEWDEQVIDHPAIQDEDGTLVAAAYTEIRPAGSIYSFRADELNYFIARGLAARLDALEAQLASLGAGA